MEVYEESFLMARFKTDMQEPNPFNTRQFSNVGNLPGLNVIVPPLIESNETKMEELMESIGPADIWDTLEQILMDQELELFRNNMNNFDDQEPE